jgi:hypothetical protein
LLNETNCYVCGSKELNITFVDLRFRRSLSAGAGMILVSKKLLPYF